MSRAAEGRSMRAVKVFLARVARQIRASAASRQRRSYYKRFRGLALR